jgi:putative heme iron utilization protein
MNEEHADAIAAYARAYGNIAAVKTAEMIGLDGHAMELAVDTGDGRIVACIRFDHALADRTDARETLIKMARRAMPSA